ncbi:MAG: ATP-binding protein [Helicobacter sp.]|nr:ATP-binding protein [Helicobacter sp.]
MQRVKDFISCKNLQENEVFKALDCSVLQGEILAFMLKNYIRGHFEGSVFALLSEFSSNNKADVLDLLSPFRELIFLGLVSESSFSQSSSSDISLLELLHLEVTLGELFFKILEGDVNAKALKITPYLDQNEYLRDEFLRISLMQKVSKNVDLESRSSKHKSRLKSLEDEISARLKISKNLPVIEILAPFELDKTEQTIFFALLKEEYSSGDNLREMSSLIELISKDEYEKIKNRTILDDKNKLIAKKILDYDEFPSFFGSLSKFFFIHEDILEKIFYPQRSVKKIGSKKLGHTLELSKLADDIFEIKKPKKSLKDIVLPKSTLDTIQVLLKQIDPKVISLLKQWGIKDAREAKIIFYGRSGTGKTITALAIAKELKRDVLSLDCSKVLSMYVGESEKNVRKIFDTYKEIAQAFKNPPILFLDEADQFLSLRASSATGADKMHNQMQNIFLEQIEKFNGILIATTNLLETIDFAFSRRFNHKIEFKLPNQNERLQIWEKHLPKNAQFQSDLGEISPLDLAKNLSVHNLSGGQISLIVKNVAYKVALKDPPIFKEADFLEAISKEKQSSFNDDKNMGFVNI